MDPNEALRRCRDLIGGNDNRVGSSEAVEAFQALDDWLCNGGFLPTAWTTVSRPAARACWHVEDLAKMLWRAAVIDAGGDPSKEPWSELPPAVQEYWIGRAKAIQP